MTAVVSTSIVTSSGVSVTANTRGSIAVVIGPAFRFWRLRSSTTLRALSFCLGVEPFPVAHLVHGHAEDLGITRGTLGCPPLGLIQSAGPLVPGGDPQHGSVVADISKTPGDFGQQGPAETPAPVVRVEVDGVELAGLAIADVGQLGTTRGEPDELVPDCEDSHVAVGPEVCEHTLPHGGPLLGSEPVEVVIGHDAPGKRPATPARRRRRWRRRRRCSHSE